MNRSVSMAILMLLILSSLCQPLSASRRGSTVEVTMADGNMVQGELLVVKADALLIFDQNSGQGKSLDIQQVAQVKVIKKSKVMLGFVIGIGAGFVIRLGDIEGQIHHNASMKPVLISALIGGAFGSLAGIPKKFSRKGKFFLNRQDLAWLRAHARDDV